MNRRGWRALKWAGLPLALLAWFLIGLGRLPRTCVWLGRQLARPWAYCELRARGFAVVGHLYVNRAARRAAAARARAGTGKLREACRKGRP